MKKWSVIFLAAIIAISYGAYNSCPRCGGWNPELFVNYSPGFIHSVEIDGDLYDSPFVGSFETGLGITWGTEYYGFWARAGVIFWNIEYDFASDMATMTEKGQAYTAMFGVDCRFREKLSGTLGAGFAVIHQRNEIDVPSSGLSDVVTDDPFIGPAFRAEFAYGVRFKIVAGFEYIYWRSDPGVYALDPMMNPVALSDDMGRHFFRPYIGIQIGQ